MEKVLGVGVIGCGEAAQLLHLPALRDLRELFKVVALHDVSPHLLETVGSKLPGAILYPTAVDLLRDGAVDAVLVATPNADHASSARLCLDFGKHVLVEKPMCITSADSERLLIAQQRTGKVVQVGFMRRHAPAFLEAASMLKEQGSTIRFARIHTVIGPNSSFIESTSSPDRRCDIPAANVEALAESRREQYREQLGSGGELDEATYDLLLGLSSHDTSAMRELFGMPKRVIYAARRQNASWISAAFDYGEFVCHFETGVDSLARFDCCIEIFTEAGVIRVEFDTPYIRHQPARLIVTQGHGSAGVKESRSFPTRNDAFVAQWRDFYNHVVAGTTPKCSVGDATQDFTLFTEMLRHMRNS